MRRWVRGLVPARYCRAPKPDRTTEAQRKTGGFSEPQAARADGRAPLLIQEGDGAFAPGGLQTLIPNP
jgi:hypothetical protein